MSKASIPFNVSARTARLIGRENVSNADGAIIELVKNCYDADSKIACIFFDIKYDSIPMEISEDQFNEIMDVIKDDRSKGSPKSNKTTILDICYQRKDKSFVLNDDLSQINIHELEQTLRRLNSLFIIDAGEGMTRDVIIDHWMTIGTDNKAENVTTKSGRVKAGAKGIGRFALDRLGEKCTMYTKATNEPANLWVVNWETFSGSGKAISDIRADLEELSNFSLNRCFNKIIKDNSFDTSGLDLPSIKFNTGTILHIKSLRDTWNEKLISKLFDNLETVVPPKDDSSFRVFLRKNNSNNWGEVYSYICNDSDYKLVFDYKPINKPQSSKKAKEITVKIYRNEIDKSLLNTKLEKELSLKISNWDKNVWIQKLSLEELMSSSTLDPYFFNRIGAFSLTLYFLKKSYTQKDKQKYFYKSFDSNKRTKWLNQLGGIKLFRDGFRVRPYGEPSGAAFDWIGLGKRAAASPAAPSHRSGQWRVRPLQISGTIHISRLTNIDFDDKSSREGIQENDTFTAFLNLIDKAIDVFEKDRQAIFRILDRYYKKTHVEEENLQKAKEYIKTKETAKQNYTTKEEKVLADALKTTEDELEKALSENQLLRSYASVGLTVSSLAHELENIIVKLVPNANMLDKYIKPILNNSSLAKKVQNRVNIAIDDLIDQSSKIAEWNRFALNSLNRDKRKMKPINLVEQLNIVKNSWNNILADQLITLSVPSEKEIPEPMCVKMYIIDFECILNNLIINSLYALIYRKDATGKREITVSLDTKDKNAVMDYYDSGPGLEPFISDPRQILEPLYSTKTNMLGEKTGTGLGMWILANIVEDYNGFIDIYRPKNGFHIKVELPISIQGGKRQ